MFGSVDEAPSYTDADEKPCDSTDDFLKIANRGGLTKPSDAVFMACVHAWALYIQIRDNEESFDLMMHSSNPRSVFTYCYLEKMLIPKCSSLSNSSCRAGCSLKPHLRKIGMSAFNLKAKNYIARKNDETAQKKRESTVSHKKSSAAKKIKKLTSS